MLAAVGGGYREPGSTSWPAAWAVTGMSNGASWGLYITMFMFFVGLSAGGLIVASSASVFHIKRFKAVAMPAIILSTVCICLAGMFVLIDLGGIQRIWRIADRPEPHFAAWCGTSASSRCIWSSTCCTW